MGFQSGINAALGSIAGAAFGIQKTLQQRQKEQTKKVEQVQAAKKTQKRNFKDYLSKMDPIYDELGPNAQKIIQQSYSKTERKKLMDTIDKENKDGNK